MEKLSGDAQIEHVQSNDTTTGKERDPAQTYEEEGVVKDAFGVKLDYSGATKKTDPVEIALVRKLDMCPNRTHHQPGCMIEKVHKVLLLKLKAGRNCSEAGAATQE